MWVGPERLLHPVMQTGTRGRFGTFTIVMSQGRKNRGTLQEMTEEKVMKGGVGRLAEPQGIRAAS